LIFVVLLAAITLMVGPRPVDATGTEAAAITDFVAIGLANAPTQFAALRGDQTRSNDFGTNYKATKCPDDSYFASCVTGFYKLTPTGSENWFYVGKSTLRAQEADVLFAMAEAAVRAGLPAGYSSQGIQKTLARASAPSLPYETWKRAGSVDVMLQIMTIQDKSYYNLTIQ
jgi:hypothetical protein